MAKFAAISDMRFKDEEDPVYESSPDFWRMIEERRKEPTIPLEQVKRELLPNGQLVDSSALYEILRNVAERKSVITYKQLSKEYAKRTKDKIHWRNWTPHLEDLSEWICSLDKTLPTIAAVVVNAQSRMPGKGFFKSARSSRMPPRAYWQDVLGRVYAAEWPESI